MATVERFEELKIWRESRNLMGSVFDSLPKYSGEWTLKDQLRRFALSAMSNIAESLERGGNKEFLQFLSIAKGSCGELRSQLIVARDLELLPEPEYRELKNDAERLNRQISSLATYLRNSRMSGAKRKREP
jgi:four helix bundle protein